jgi:hypothetical protein
MKLIYNKVIPFKGFAAINLFGVLFVREELREYYEGSKPAMLRLLRHEGTHTQQMQEMLYIGFFAFYFIEWLVRFIYQLFKGGRLAIINPEQRKPLGKFIAEVNMAAYSRISFEREARRLEGSAHEYNNRKHYGWVKYI